MSAYSCGVEISRGSDAVLVADAMTLISDEIIDEIPIKIP